MEWNYNVYHRQLYDFYRHLSFLDLDNFHQRQSRLNKLVITILMDIILLISCWLHHSNICSTLQK